MRVLDVGSGPKSKLTSAYLEIEVVRCDKHLYPGVELQDMEKLTYPDDSFDVVVCINALDHTKNPRMAITEMIRVSRGLVYIDCALMQLSQSGGWHYWDVQEDGTFTSKSDEFNIKDFGFEVELVDNGGPRRYNHIHAKYNCSI